MKKKENNIIHTNKEKTALTGVLSGFSGVILTIIMAATANSIAILADMFSTILDFLSILISWLTLRVTKRNKTQIFNYGFGKIENLSSLIVAIFMFLSLIIIAYTTFHRFNNPVPIKGFGVRLGIILHIIYGGINSSLWWKSRKLFIESPSPMIEAQTRLFSVKAFNNVIILTSLVLGTLMRKYSWIFYLDPVVSIFIATVMIFNGYNIMRDSINNLLDQALEEALQLLIVRSLTDHFELYEQLHGQRSRRSGGVIFIELFLEFSQDKLMKEVHKSIDIIKNDIENKISNSQVIIVPTIKPMKTY